MSIMLTTSRNSKSSWANQGSLTSKRKSRKQSAKKRDWKQSSLALGEAELSITMKETNAQFTAIVKVTGIAITEQPKAQFLRNSGIPSRTSSLMKSSIDASWYQIGIKLVFLNNCFYIFSSKLYINFICIYTLILRNMSHNSKLQQADSMLKEKSDDNYLTLTAVSAQARHNMGRKEGESQQNGDAKMGENLLNYCINSDKIKTSLIELASAINNVSLESEEQPQSEEQNIQNLQHSQIEQQSQNLQKANSPEQDGKVSHEDVRQLIQKEIMQNFETSGIAQQIDNKTEQNLEHKQQPNHHQGTLQRIGLKMKAGFQQFICNFQRITVEQENSSEISQHYKPANANQFMKEQVSTFQCIGKKMKAGLQQFIDNFQRITVEQENSSEIKQQHYKFAHVNQFMKEQMGSNDDNEFMANQFHSGERMEEIQKYCEALNAKVCEKVAADHPQHQTKEKDQKCFKQQSAKIKGSSQSQRNRSSAGSKKGSDSEDFNLDLTVKTKNQKNPFSYFNKQDSLMYSAQSDFGYHPSSPNKSHRKKEHTDSNKSVLQKIDDLEEDPSSMINLDRSQSQIFESQKQVDRYSQKSKHKKSVNSHSIDNGQQKMGESMRDISNVMNGEQKNKKEESIRESIANNSDFEADDEGQKEFESANFEKKQFEHVIRKRVETEVRVKKQQPVAKSNQEKFKKVSTSNPTDQQSKSNIFSTEVNTYQSKISKLKQVKELRKKKLEEELEKVNREINMLREKQEEMGISQTKNSVSRVKISSNIQANRRAESLVKNLRSQKRNRDIAKIGEFKNLDKNINEYMDELAKLRLENEEKMKQKKKLEILERMKHQEIRKLKEKKKIEVSQRFVLQLKGASSPYKDSQPSKRSPTKQEQEPQQSQLTPELSQKKAYLNKIRSFSVKKPSRDIYEQVLG